MAFLLLLHEKMKVKRQLNKLMLKQARQGGRLERLVQNIEKKHKIYDMREASIDKQAQMMQTQATTIFQNMMGLGAQNQAFNPLNMSGNSMTSFVINNMQSALEGGFIHINQTKDNPEGEAVQFTDGMFQQMLTDYYQTGLKQNYSKDGKTKLDTYGAQEWEKKYVDAFMIAMNGANNNQSQARMMTQQMTANYQNNISIWVEAQKSQIQAEEDAVLSPLEMMQTEMELENESIATQIEILKEKKQSLESACKEGIQDSVPKFGLG